MHTLEIPRKRGKNKIIEFPERWEEMTEKQFLKIMELVLAFENQEIDYTDFMTQATLVLVGIVLVDAPRSRRDEETINGNIAILSEYFDWLLKSKRKDGRKLISLNFKSVKNFLPKIKSFIGPEDGIANLSWDQHSKASVAYKEYVKTQNEVYLNRLVASLYTEPKGFDADKLDAISDKIADISKAHKQAVFLFYRNCLSFIQNETIRINGENIKLGILFEDSKEGGKPDGLGLVGLQMSIAESGVFGNMEQVGKQNVYDVYAYLYKNKHEYLEFKRKMKQND